MDADFYMFQNMLNNAGKENGVVAEFYDKAVKTDKINDKGFPVFDNVTFVRIRCKDNPDVFDQPAYEKHFKRFPVEYSRFLLAKKETENGTPLNQFAFLSAEQLEACKYRGIFTVERLAELEDERAKDLGLAEEKVLAQKFIAVSSNNKAIADFENKEKEYQAKIKELEDKIKELEQVKGSK